MQAPEPNLRRNLRSIAEHPGNLSSFFSSMNPETYNIDRSKETIMLVKLFVKHNKDIIFHNVSNNDYINSLNIIEQKCNVLEANIKERKTWFALNWEYVVKDAKTIKNLSKIRNFITEFKLLNFNARQNENTHSNVDIQTGLLASLSPPQIHLHKDIWYSIASNITDVNDLISLALQSKTTLNAVKNVIIQRLNSHEENCAIEFNNYREAIKVLKILGPEGREKIKRLSLNGKNLLNFHFKILIKLLNDCVNLNHLHLHIDNYVGSLSFGMPDIILPNLSYISTNLSNIIFTKKSVTTLKLMGVSVVDFFEKGTFKGDFSDFENLSELVVVNCGLQFYTTLPKLQKLVLYIDPELLHKLNTPQFKSLMPDCELNIIEGEPPKFL